MGMDALNNAANFQQSKPMVAESYQYGSEAPVQQVQAPLPQMRMMGSGKQIGQASEEEIKSAISSANRRAHFGHTNAEFSYHEATKRISVKIIDKETNEVIREIPPEETLEMISKMWELAGIMVDEKR